MKIPYMKIPMETHIHHFLQTLWSVKTHVDASDAKDAQRREQAFGKDMSEEMIANGLYNRIKEAKIRVTGRKGDELPWAKDVPLPVFHLKTVISQDDYDSFKQSLNYFAYGGLQQDLEELLNRGYWKKSIFVWFMRVSVQAKLLKMRMI